MFVPFAYYEGNKDKLKLVPVDDGKADNGDGAISSFVKWVTSGSATPSTRWSRVVTPTRRSAPRSRGSTPSA